jgi:chromosomal replication initiator protein
VGKTSISQQVIKNFLKVHPSGTVQEISGREWPRSTPDEEIVRAFRDVDLLIVDDLQHLAERDRDDFAQLLDQRSPRKRWTVCISTLSPAQLIQFPHRITSRLASGLVVRIDAPAVESRKVLATHFARKKKVPLAEETIPWLARNAQNGIRGLIGLIEQLRPLARRYPQGITISQAKAWLQEAELATERRPSLIERIITKVCLAFRVKARDLTGSSRLRTVLIPRQVAMYLANKVAKMPLTRIGAHFGNRDHTTVLHAVRKIETTIQADAQLARVVRELQSEVL